VGCGFEGLAHGSSNGRDDDLDWVMREERGGEAVGGGEEAVLRAMPAKASSVFLGEDAVAFVAGEGVHSNQGDGGDGIGAGRGGILKGLRPYVEAAHGGGVGRRRRSRRLRRRRSGRSRGPWFYARR